MRLEVQSNHRVIQEISMSIPNPPRNSVFLPCGHPLMLGGVRVTAHSEILFVLLSISI